IFGFIGGPYPNESRFQLIRFARSANNIDIIIKRFDAGGRGDGYRSWKIVYLSATLPDLPPGRYSVECNIQDAATSPQCDLEIPNPVEQQRIADRAHLKDLTDDALIREYAGA